MTRGLVMGVLNVTPDSFSDGGRFIDPATAIEHGRRLFAEGADIVDVGGESTRPGSEPVSVEVECERVLPVIAALASVGRISVDTSKAPVAEAAIAAGATVVNDISASLAHVAAAHGAGWVAMHMQGTPRTMQAAPAYGDVVEEVATFLLERAEAGRAAGVTEMWIDPGIGFGKNLEHNLALLRQLRRLVGTGIPVAVGASRKGFLGTLTGGAPEDDRLEASLAVASWAFAQGVSMVRAHDVAATFQAARIVTEEVAA